MTPPGLLTEDINNQGGEFVLLVVEIIRTCTRCSLTSGQGDDGCKEYELSNVQQPVLKMLQRITEQHKEHLEGAAAATAAPRKSKKRNAGAAAPSPGKKRNAGAAAAPLGDSSTDSSSSSDSNSDSDSSSSSS